MIHRTILALIALVAIVAFVGTASAQQQQKTTTFDVLSSVGSFCGDPDAGTPVNIGEYDPLNPVVSTGGSGAITVTCVRGIPVDISLDGGTNVAAARLAGRCTNLGERAMSDGDATSPSYLCYIIDYTGATGDSTAPTLAQRWGSAESEFGSSITGQGQGATATYAMNIWAPAGQLEAKQANYSDTVTVTITY